MNLASKPGVGRIWLYGILMLLPMLALTWRFPLPGNVRPTDLGHMSHYGPREFLLFVASVVMLFALYLLALRAARRLPARDCARPVFTLAVCFTALLAWMYPVDAIDIFVYVVYARIFTVHHLNPIAVPASEIRGDAIISHYAAGGWQYYPAPYGPLWTLISAPIGLLGGDSVALALAGFKLLTIASFLAGGWVIYRTARQGEAGAAALFYLWNPLMLWDVAANGHNDAVMALPVLGALLAWTKGRTAWVLPLLITAAMIKYTVAPLIPLGLVATWRCASDRTCRRRLLLRSAVASLLIVAVALYPFYDLGAVARSIESTSNLFLVSPSNMLVGMLKHWYPVAELRHWLRVIGGGVLLLALAWGCLEVWRRPSALPRRMFEILFVLLIVTPYFMVWYLTSPTAVASVLPGQWPRWRMIAWTTGAMLAAAYFTWIGKWWIHGPLLLRLGILIIYGPALLLTLLEVLLCLRRRGRRLVAE